MEDPVTEAMVSSWAIDTLREWLNKSYTDHLSDGHQRRVKLVGDHEDCDVYLVKDLSGHLPERRFKVSVVVEEIE